MIREIENRRSIRKDVYKRQYEIFCAGETWQHLLGVDRDRGDDCAASWRRGRRDYDWYIYGFGFEYILTGPTHVLESAPQRQRDREI